MRCSTAISHTNIRENIQRARHHRQVTIFISLTIKKNIYHVTKYQVINTEIHGRPFMNIKIVLLPVAVVWVQWVWLYLYNMVNTIIVTLPNFGKDSPVAPSHINFYVQSCFCDLSSRNYVPSSQLSLF